MTHDTDSGITGAQDGVATLLSNNRAWSRTTIEKTPTFFEGLAAQQSPKYLWIGCSDSRVPANEIVGLAPGELFVHRNIANIVPHTDLNCLSVIQYAVDVLGVQHIIVCGHYGCGGVAAAFGDARLGLIDNWLRHLRDVYYKHSLELGELSHDDAVRRLCELNVREQVLNVTETTVVRDAWSRGQTLAVHGWAYGLDDGLAHDLRITRTNTVPRATDTARTRSAKTTRRNKSGTTLPADT